MIWRKTQPKSLILKDPRGWDPKNRLVVPVVAPLAGRVD